MAQSYKDTHAARHAAGKTYLEKCAAEDAARIQEMRQKSADELLNVQTNGAVGKQDAGRMRMKSRAKTPKPKKDPIAKPKHVGFSGAEKKVEKEGYSKKSAGAIIASATRKASPAAKRKNPRLKKVKTTKKK